MMPFSEHQNDAILVTEKKNQGNHRRVRVAEKDEEEVETYTPKKNEEKAAGLSIKGKK